VAVDGRHNGLRIESGLPGGQSVVWRPAADAPADQPLLRLDGPGAARVKGFTFDGAKRQNTLVRVSGPCAGLRLEDLYFTDAQQQALVLADCAAPPDQPLTVERVRFTTLHDYSVASNHTAEAVRPAALECTAALAGGPPAGPLSLAVRWCRFEGLYKTALLVACPIDAEVRLNRFYTLRTDERPPQAKTIDAIGVQVTAVGPVRLTIASNTMSRFTNFLHLDKLPPADGGSKIVLRNNLVMGTSEDAWVTVGGKVDEAAAKALFAGSDGNVCRPGTAGRGLGAAVIPRKFVPFGYIDVTLGTDQFLRYKKTGDTLPLLTAGANGGSVGVPPLN
jgi:hypothetical protein